MAVTFIWIVIYDLEPRQYVPKSHWRRRMWAWARFLLSWMGHLMKLAAAALSQLMTWKFRKRLTMRTYRKQLAPPSDLPPASNFFVTALRNKVHGLVKQFRDNSALMRQQSAERNRHRQRRQRLALALDNHQHSNRRARITAPIRMMAILTVMSLLAHSVKHNGSRGRSNMFDSDSGAVGIDSRCSACISDRKEDFGNTLRPCNKVVKVFGGALVKNVMTGTITWNVEDNSGRSHTFSIPGSYYVPDGQVRLMSPQHWAKVKPDHKPRPNGTRCVTNDDSMELQWAQRKHKLTVQIDPAINVATFYLAPGYSAFQAFCAEADLEDDNDPLCFDVSPVSDDESAGDDEDDGDASVSSMDSQDSEGALRDSPISATFELNDDLTSTNIIDPDEEDTSSNLPAELLRYHHRYNHIPMKKLRYMAKNGIIPKRLAKCPVPTCSACMYGKATRKPWRSKLAKNRKVSRTATRPGQVVGVDHMVSPTPGLIAQMAGFITKKRYKYATVFVDHATGYGYTHVQRTQSAEETLEAKTAFERHAAIHGVQVLHYHSDNGIFASQAWRTACANSNQGLTFAGVNAHHQNGFCERRIRELQDLTRSSMIHAQKRWPETINAHLWPYALRMACDAYNEANGNTGDPSPLEKFSKSFVQPNPKHWQPFGCPVFVLDNKLQSGKGIKHKWDRRSRIGVYLGRSPHHARNVALVLNIKTGRVSPQFHVAFDPSFQTVKANYSGEAPLSLWQSACGFEEAPSVHADDGTQRQATGRSARNALSTDPASGTEREGTGNQAAPVDPLTDPTEATGPANLLNIGGQTRNAGTRLPTASNTTNNQVDNDVAPVTATTSRGRQVRAPVRLIQVMLASVMAATVITGPEGASEAFDHLPAEGELLCYQSVFQETDQHRYDQLDPLFAFGATNDPDTLYYHEAMQAPDRDQFKESMVKEFEDQMKNGNFIFRRKADLPSNIPILPAVWAMRRKRKSDTGEIYKWKSRCNLDGSKQVQDRDFYQTYAPVAAWPSVRALLVLVLINGWHTVQLDFVQAFPQCNVSHKQFMHMPKGITIEGVNADDTVLEVIKNIYGGKDAGRQWFKYLKKKLESVGFVQSRIDHCVFYKGNAIYVLYTDDSILAGPDQAELDDIVVQMKSTGLDLTVEGDVADFLGVHIDRREDGTFHLSQPRLIDSILSDLGLDQPNSTAKGTPAACSKLLSRHLDSEPFDRHFDYRRAVGKLNYLEKTSRGDIAYATHQCARFSIDPRVEHGLAVKWIGRYLLGTRDKGYIIKPDPSRGLEVYVDADLSGNWDKDLAGIDPDTARSRHGFVIMYAGAPILWQSQLQTEIALSSTESELIGMSMALRTAIPIMRLFQEMKEMGYDVFPGEAQIHCKLFEDNNGALTIARVPKMRPRTKHINLKYFHFMEYTGKEKNPPISLHRIDTTEQPADTLTKANDQKTLEKHRKFIWGW